MTGENSVKFLPPPQKKWNPGYATGHTQRRIYRCGCFVWYKCRAVQGAWPLQSFLFHVPLFSDALLRL